jgi:sugar phosphate isomerase/epimerase
MERHAHLWRPRQARGDPGPNTAKFVYHDFPPGRRQEISPAGRKDLATMMIETGIGRPLGTMVAYGFPTVDLAAELALARRIGASLLEALPEWRTLPDPGLFRRQATEAGLAVHSAHGCWGGQAISAWRVDLGEPSAPAHRAAVDDLKQCVDWLATAGGTCLVVHPGGLSEPADAPARRAALARGLLALADHARGTGVTLCVENMPPGVHPGSRMADLFALLVELDRPELALALDTGHAHITATAVTETHAAGRLLRTTHVHDNDGRQDVHLPPGLGTLDWPAWLEALDAVDYHGPIMLECVRHLRNDPESPSDALRGLLRRLTRSGVSNAR